MRRLEIQREEVNTWPFLKCLSDRCRDEFMARYGLHFPVRIEESEAELKEIMERAPEHQARVK